MSFASFHRVERRRGDVDSRLDRGVDHLGDEDERDRDEEGDQLEAGDVRDERRDQHHDRDREVDPHVPLGAEHVDDPLDRVVEALDDRGRAARRDHE